jgi:hypothetical protein
MRATAAAVAGALEAVGHVTAWNGESRDPDTKNFRFSFTVEFLTPR